MAPLILVVDDNRDVTQLVSVLLQSKGYDTMIADSGEQALQCMAERRPDLILCDIMMPGMDGFQVFRSVRADRRWQMVPFVFLTALTDTQVRFSTTELGVEAYITKPFDRQELLSVVAGQLRRASELQSHTLSEMDTFKSQLLFMITHELNTPLSVIRMMTDSMRSNVNRLSRPQITEYLELLARSTGELSTIIESMLLALQIDSGRAQELYDHWAIPQLLNTIVDAVVTQAGPKAVERGVLVETQNIDQPLWVKAHEQQLMQIFARILDNAIRFSPRGGHVLIQIRQANGQACVTIVDQGPGLSPDEIEMAFDRLRQINRAQYEQQGVGLSLNLVRSLTDIHSGKITVDSAPGKGSAFSVWLPLTLPPALSPR
jgi:signal transduction histidine kinase